MAWTHGCMCSNLVDSFLIGLMFEERCLDRIQLCESRWRNNRGGFWVFDGSAASLHTVSNDRDRIQFDELLDGETAGEDPGCLKALLQVCRVIGPSLRMTHFLRMLLVLFHQGRLQCRLVGLVPLKCYFSPLSYVRRRPRRCYLEKFISLASVDLVSLDCCSGNSLSYEGVQVFALRISKR